MKTIIKIGLVLMNTLILGCSGSKDILKETLASENKNIKTVMANPAEFELQIIYTQIKRDKDNKPILKDFTYNLDANNYFYPASTVKFPIAVLALEKLNTISNTSINTQYTIDNTTEKLRFSEEISKVFAVSDNEASNNLFEFIGFDYLNDSMHAKGLKPFRISHRISTPNSGNPLLKSITLYKDDNSVVNFPSKTDSPSVPLAINNLKKGIGYLKDDVLINEAFDFSEKNYYPLETLHNTLKRIIFPENFKESERFNLTKTDREFILFSMQNLPKNAGYDPIEYYDGYCKFFMFGDTKETIPSTIKIYNKVGDAYGTLTDCAYIVDAKNKVEFMLSATILVNKDGVFNDDIYDYDAVGLPFLAELGRQLYLKNLKEKH